MSDMQDYKSSLADVSSRKFETFSYLPEMSAEQVRKQVEYIVSKGWNPAVEHCEPEHAFDHYWYMWKLPMFGETDVDRILAEAEACHKAHPQKSRAPDRLRQLLPVQGRRDGGLPRYPGVTRASRPLERAPVWQ
jgi:ribulose-bisphosphate carboxylase small chain